MKENYNLINIQGGEWSFKNRGILLNFIGPVVWYLRLAVLTSHEAVSKSRQC